MTVNTLQQDIYVVTNDDDIFVTTESNSIVGQSSILFQDEGLDLGTQGTVNKINFVGSAVTASRSGQTLTVNISGGGSLSIGSSVSGSTNGSILFVNNGVLAQGPNNLFWNNASMILSVATAGDTSGTDSINIYNQYDAYLPQSSQGTPGSTTFAGLSFSTSRGTGTSPSVVASGNWAGGAFGWIYTGSSPAYKAAAGFAVKAVGASADMGGQFEIWTKADGASLTQRLVVTNDGAVVFQSLSADPALVTGGIWFNTTANSFKARLNTNTYFFPVSTQQGTANQIAYYVSGGFLFSNSNLTFDGTTLTLASAGNFVVNSFIQFKGLNTTGAGSAALGANCPAVTATAPYTWLKAISSDGSTVYIPCWK